MVVELPEFVRGLPTYLRWGQVVRVMRATGMGGRFYCEDLRDLGYIRSVNAFASGARARYSKAEVLGLVLGNKKVGV